ncbi:alpha/beta fold hydrolase [Mangrovicella endophytica]|uniref:alpha/beta fold hydrolase n=1 Tax=Mangrovicella endophytica TaxID=2066697 RepID=UPI000C9E8210|nr:alpha/beta hydrolase [Mangrovicella endophytica]
MFEDFETKTLAGDGAAIHCRIAGSGSPLLLLHGYPQTGALWADVAPGLTDRHRVVVPDLRGYGRSEAPASSGGEGYSKRRMGADMVAVMAGLGFERFAVAGHDRGARVAYRLALDHPERVSQLAVLDVVPTLETWGEMDWKAALTSYHWPFLAQAEPLPERLIGHEPDFYLEWTIRSWTKKKSLEVFRPEALAEYRAAFRQPERIHAACEDYRAGATIDRILDIADRDLGRRIKAPMLVLWGSAGTPAKGRPPLTVWREWCDSVTGREIDCGHFLPEEAPGETLAALRDFFD